MIAIEDITLQFENSFVVAQGFDANIPERASVAVVGPSGCGKTTLLRALRGAVLPTRGTIRIAGSPAVLGRRDVFHSPQAPALLGYRTVLANAVLGVELLGELSETKVAQARDLIARLGLEAAIGQRSDRLSGGMAKRVALAQALLSDAKYLLIDEPFASLDVVNRRNAEEVLAAEIKRRDSTCVFAAHDLDSVVAVADAAYVISGPPWFKATLVPISPAFSDCDGPAARRTATAFSAAVAGLQEAVTIVSSLS